MKIIRFLILPFFIFFSIHSFAQVEAIAGNMIIGSLVDDLKYSIQQIINEIDDAVSRNSFETRQNLIMVLNSLENMSTTLVDKTFDELNDTQKEFFNNTQLTITKAKEDGAILLKDVNNTLTALNSTLSILPFTKTRPRINNYSPRYSSFKENQESFHVSINGAFLDLDEPRLILESVDCKLIEKLSHKLTFECQCEHLRAEDEVVYQTGRLETYYFNDTWRPFESWWKERDVIPFTLLLYSVPNKLGTIDVSAIVEEDNIVSQPRSGNFGYTNEHCHGAKAQNWQVNCTKGWFVDPTSVSVKVTARSKKSSYHGVHALNETGFQIRGNVANNGSCGPKKPFSNSRLYYDGRGTLQVSYSFVETQTTKKKQTSELTKDKLINWGEDQIFKLPERTIGIIVNTKQIDGSNVVNDNSVSEQWFELKYDKKLNHIIYKPKRLDVALSSN